jgi:Cof subfamily protein (haloacid dehalogenase superfamily)
VATDIDGTLIGSDGKVSARTVEVIRRVEAAGALFVMVTGRPPRWMADISEQTGHAGLAVCANGALVYDLHEEVVIQSHLLRADVIAEVVEAMRSQIPGITFAVERPDLTFGHEHAYVPSSLNAGAVIADLDELIAEGAVKLLVRHRGMGPDDLLAAARTAVGDRATLTHSSADGLLEISAAGITKASGLAALADDEAIEPHEVVAFGDMPNDLPMLTWAGLGVAVANAHPDVLDIADEVTASNDDDGVAVVLERWF